MRLGGRTAEDIYESARTREAGGGEPAPPLRALGVGAAKTGTHSLAAVLKGAFKVHHELKARAMIEAVLAYSSGELDRARLLAWVAKFEAKAGVEISVSQINGFLIEEMVELHPRALCLLTVRDARSWLKSMVNAILVAPLDPKSGWSRFRDLRFDVSRHPFQPDDEPLRRRGLHSLEAYLSYWADHNLRVVGAVAPERLMVLPIRAIDRELPRIAEALGVAPERLRPEHSHRNAVRYLDSPLDELDPQRLEDRLRAHSERLWTGARDCLAKVERDRLEEAIFGAREPAAPGS